MPARLKVKRKGEADAESVENSSRSLEVVGARNLLFALEAAKRSDVRELRAEIVGPKLLQPSKVPEWLKGHERRQDAAGQRTILRVEQFSGTSEYDFQPGVVCVDRPLWIHVNVRGTREDPLISEQAAVYAEGPLGKLLALSNRLEMDYFWPSADAAGWLLTGRPFTPMITIIHDAGPGYVTNATPYGQLRIEVPPEIPARDVAVTYSSFRIKELEGRDSALGGRGRLPGRKQLALVRFAASRNDGRTWTQLLDEWNREAKKPWRYSSYRNLARDARDTYLRLMGSPLDWGQTDAESEKEGDDGEA